MFINYWKNKKNLLIWKKNPKKTYSFKNGKHAWYEDGLLNASYNCLDANINLGLGNKVAIYYFDKDKKFFSATYKELLGLVSNCSSFLKDKTKDIKKFKIIIYGSASLETSILMLSCARMGVHFSVIFQDLSYEAVKIRAKLLNANVLISRCADKVFYTKLLKDKIFKKKNIILTSFNKIDILGLKSVNLMKLKYERFFSPKFVQGSNNFFTLFTSGSTGQPKGVTHSTAGYLIYNKLTCKKKFGISKDSVIFTASDAGWINGHSYALFGPLSLGASTVILEVPYLILDHNFLKLILKTCRVTILYLPVTLIRLMKSIYTKRIKSKYLKVIGSMGEPLAQNVGKWFAKNFHLSKKAIINTYFQTETGGIISSADYKKFSYEVKHGSSGKALSSYLGLFLDKSTQPPEFKIKNPWPGCMKSIINSEKIFQSYYDENNYFKLFDTGYFDNKNNIFVTGRIDDVINIRGHRIGSSEFESVILANNNVKEACAISVNSKLEGSVFVLFLVSRDKKKINKDYINKAIALNFGNFAIPKNIFQIPELPKTRSGKILRRVLRFIYMYPNKKYISDLSTILNPNILPEIKKIVIHEKY
jgi:acetyl-CoA synthetase